LLAVGYGLAKAYVHHRVTSELDRLIEMAIPFADVSYGGVKSDLGGKLTVERIEVTHLASGFNVNISALELQGDDYSFLVELMSGMDKGEPPSKLSARIVGAEFPASSDFFAQSDGSSGSKKVKKVCTLGGIMQHSELEELGHSTIIADAGLGYEFDREQGTLKAEFDYSVSGIESFVMDFRLRGVAIRAMDMLTAPPVLEDVKILYTLEPEYMQEAVQHCAEKNGQEPVEFIDSLFARSGYYFKKNLGFVPGPGLKDVLREMVSKAGTLRIDAMPPPDFTMEKISMYRQQDLANLMDLEVSINDKLVTDLSYSLVSGGPDIEGGEGLDDPERVRWTYQEVKQGELGKYLGRRVRLYVKGNATPKTGELDNVTAREISVDQRVHRGTITAHVPTGLLERVEVYLPEKSEKKAEE
jgi:hypothetical protein